MTSSGGFLSFACNKVDAVTQFTCYKRFVPFMNTKMIGHRILHKGKIDCKIFLYYSILQPYYVSLYINFDMMKHTFLILPYSYEHIINNISGGGNLMFTIDIIHLDN